VFPSTAPRCWPPFPSELETAIEAIRGTDKVTARAEESFKALLDLNAAELQVSPGRAWLALVRQDFADAVHLRADIARYDALSGPDWHALLEDSAALAAGVQEELQKPARRGMIKAAEYAARSAAAAKARCAPGGCGPGAARVSGTVTASISVPVRRSTAATGNCRRRPHGARPRGGSG
jgi:hypothetical protein